MAYLKICKNKNCKKKFEPERSFQTTCGYKCAIEYARQLEEKKQKAKKKARKESLKEKLGKNYQPTKQSPLALAQKAVNRYIRARDKEKPCISCQRPYNVLKKINAGHYKSVGGNNSLRFNTYNINLQCEYCNTFKNGNLQEYRVNLIKKIGLEKVEKLEAPQEIKKFSTNYYERIAKIFNKRAKRLEDKI